MKKFFLLGIMLLTLGSLSGQILNKPVLVDSIMVHFKTDEARLDIAAKQRISKGLDRLDSLKRTKIIIEAHTDNIGAEEYNVKLSENRALSIKNHLVSLGLPDSIITIAFFGEKIELATNQTLKGRSLNRRAILKLFQYLLPIEQPSIPETTFKIEVIDLQSKIGQLSDIVISGKNFREVTSTDSSGKATISLPKETVFKFQAFPANSSYTPALKMAKTDIKLSKSPLIIEVSSSKAPIQEEIIPSKLLGKVIDKSTGLGIPSYLIIEGPMYRDSLVCDAEGRFNLEFRSDHPMEVSAFSDGYFFQTKTILPKHSKLEPIIFQLSKLEMGLQFTMNLHFISGTPRLLPSSIPELHYLLKVVEASGDLCFKIDGHVNFPNAPPVGKSTFSWRLSWDRAREVKRFLIDKGISKNRLSHEGFGNWHMVEPFARSEKEMQRNRRVEVSIVVCPE